MSEIARDALIERIAMCAHPDGIHEHIPLKPGEPMPTTCFADCCDCTPVEYVRATTTTQGAVSALRELLAAQDDAYAASASGSGRAPETIERLAKAMDAARLHVRGSKTMSEIERDALIEHVATAMSQSAADRPRKEGTRMRFRRYAEAAIDAIAAQRPRGGSRTMSELGRCPCPPLSGAMVLDTGRCSGCGAQVVMGEQVSTSIAQTRSQPHQEDR